MYLDKNQLKAFGITLLAQIIPRISSSYTFCKLKKSGVITKISPELKSGEYNINEYLKFDKYNQIITDFEHILKTRLSHFNNTAFYENLKTLKLTEETKGFLKKLKDILSKKVVGGDYYSDKNEMTVYDGLDEISDHGITTAGVNKEDTASHELLHMATTYKKGIITACGFNLNIGSLYEIGRGINEGYTERINLKYFSKRKYSHSYTTLRFLSEGIERIIGKEKMEKLYSNGDLVGLVSEISNYCSEEQAAILIEKMDDCHNADRYEEQEEKARKIRVEIGNMLLFKQKKLLEEKTITQDEYEREVIRTAFFVKESRFEFDDVNGEITVTAGDNPNGEVMPIDAYRVIRNTYFMNKKEPITFDIKDAEYCYGGLIEFMSTLTRKMPVSIKLSELEYIEPIEGELGEYKFVTQEEISKSTAPAVSTELNDMFKKDNSISQNISSKKMT